MPLFHSAIVTLAAGTYVHLGVFRVSLANLLYLLAILALLIAALVVHFPHAERDDDLGSDAKGVGDVHSDR